MYHLLRIRFAGCNENIHHLNSMEIDLLNKKSSFIRNAVMQMPIFATFGEVITFWFQSVTTCMACSLLTISAIKRQCLNILCTELTIQ